MALTLSIIQAFSLSHVDWVTSIFQVIDAYSMIDDGGLGEKVQNCFVQIVVLETHSVLKNVLNEVCKPNFRYMI